MYERVRARNFSQAWSFLQCAQSIPIVVGVNLAEFLNCHVSHKSGYLFGFFCALSGSIILFLVDVHKRNISRHRHTRYLHFNTLMDLNAISLLLFTTFFFFESFSFFSCNVILCRSNGTTHLCKLKDCPEHRKLSFTQEPDIEAVRNFNVGNLLLRSDPLGNQISEEFVIEPKLSGNVVIPLDQIDDKPELTCISEEGIADMDLPDNIFDDFDYLGDCITSCNKVIMKSIESPTQILEFQNGFAFSVSFNSRSNSI